MITRFKIFEKNEDIDPYGEDNWGFDIDLKVGDKIVNTSNPLVFGEVLKIKNDVIILGEKGKSWEIIYDEVAYWIESGICHIEKGILENFNDVDPYGEEDWSEKFYTIDDLNIGDDIYHIDHFYGKIISIGEVYIVFKDINGLVPNSHRWKLDNETVLKALEEGRMKIVKR